MSGGFMIVVVVIVFFVIVIVSSMSNSEKADSVVFEEFKKIDFVPVKQIVVSHNISLYVDETSKRFALTKYSAPFYDVFSFNDLLGFDVKQDNDVVSSGNMMGAATGALLAGTAGAIIGSAAGKNEK